MEKLDLQIQNLLKRSEFDTRRSWKDTLRNSFNVDECALNGFTIPDRGMAAVLLSGLKKSKQWISILFVCNGDGSEKLPPFFIGRTAQPQCFGKKTAKELGYYYKSNKKAWMTTVLFEE